MNDETFKRWIAMRSFLVVEDVSVTRMMVAATLKSFGATQVVDAADGVEALSAIERQVPDIILCDWQMPNMNGIALLCELIMRGNPSKFFMLTARTDDDEIRYALAAGADGFLGKPLSKEMVVAALTPLMLEQMPALGSA